MSIESQRVNDLAEWYTKEQLDFDKRMIRFRYETLKPYFLGPIGLEQGPAEGEMTQFLVHDFEFLTIVEGASELLNNIPERKNLTKIHSLFEDFNPSVRYNTIILEHILEHVDSPVELLACAKKWLAPDGKLLLGVPNGDSMHRLVAVKMGLLGHSCELNERDIALGHRRVYTPGTLQSDIDAAGLHLEKIGGVFLKPLSNKQIQDNWDESMITGFYELGKDFPQNAAEIYAVCS